MLANMENVIPLSLAFFIIQKDNSYFPYAVGTHAVLAICHAVAGVEKQSAQNYVFALRYYSCLIFPLLFLITIHP